MQVKRMKMADLKVAEYNPESRTIEGSKNLKTLEASIARIGLIYPLAVDSKGNIIDGHRRYSAAKALGWDEIPVLIVGEGISADEAYAEINACNLKMDGNQTLQVFIKNPNAVTARSRRLLEGYEQMAGRDLLIRLIKNGGSVRTLQTAKSIGTYTEDNAEAFYRKTVRWLMKHRAVVLVNHYMQLQQPAKTLHEAIAKNRPLVSNITTG